MTEPWLRGPIDGIPGHLMPVFHSFAQVREDLAKHTEGLGAAEVWRDLGSIPPLGFQLRHIAGSVDRLVTYLTGGELNVSQFEFLKHEAEPDASLEELMIGINASLERAEAKIRTIRAEQLYEPRYVGKKRLGSTVLGLLVHVAEHTQRHVGQAITTAKVLKAQRSG